MHTDCQLLPQTMATFDNTTKVYPFTGLITLLSALTTFKHNHQHRREIYIYTYNCPSIYMYLHTYGHECLHSLVILNWKCSGPLFCCCDGVRLFHPIGYRSLLTDVREGSQAGAEAGTVKKAAYWFTSRLLFVTLFIPSGFLRKDGTTHSGLNCPPSIS